MIDDVNMTTESSLWLEENLTVISNTTEVLPTVSSSSNGRISIFLLVVSILLFIFAAISAVSNLTVILAFFFERKLRSNFTTLIVNQAVADFMVSVIPMPLLTATILVGYWPFGRIMCGIWCVVDYSATLASVYALGQPVWSLDRPLWYLGRPVWSVETVNGSRLWNNSGFGLRSGRHLHRSSLGDEMVPPLPQVQHQEEDRHHVRFCLV